MVRQPFDEISVAVVLMQTGALAQSTPPMFVYKITMTPRTGTGSTDYAIDVAIKSTNPDGSRQALLTVHAPKMPPIDGKSMDASTMPAKSRKWRRHRTDQCSTTRVSPWWHAWLAAIQPFPFWAPVSA